jgi:hypothetical protein
MQPVQSKPAVKEPPADDSDARQVQAGAQSDTEPFDAKSGEDRKALADLKARIAEAKRNLGLPVDSALGNPEWERRAADGRFDLPDDDKDE